jgi:acetyl esterase/lipase
MPSTEHEALVAHLRSSTNGRTVTSSERPSREAQQAARALMEEQALPIPDGVEARDAAVGGVHALWFHPDGADPSRVFLYFHGGGYMFGTPRNTGHVTARLARAAACDACSVDYRLSWQAPFPAPVEDAVAAYLGLLDDGFTPDRIALAGDSAGGGLVLALLVALRDRGVASPAAGFASSPFTDLTVSGASATSVDDPIAKHDELRMLGDAYLDGADPRSPLASPLYADVRGLPPILLQVGGLESLLDDSIRMAAHLEAAGVDVTLEVLEGVLHIWQYFGPDLPETKDSERAAGAFLRRHLGG